MRPPTFRDAVNRALRDELASDPTVLLFGEDVAAAGGVFQVTRGLAAEFGPQRVFDTPISELALAGAAFGSAVTGYRPVIEIMFGDFAALAADSLINQAAKYCYWSGGRHTVPIVVRTTMGAGGRFGAIHSQSPAALFLNVPGIKVVAPSNAEDAYGLLRASIRDDGPVVFIEHKGLYQDRASVASFDVQPQELGVARTLREGGDVTVVGVMKSLKAAVEAADWLSANDGVECDVIDPRCLKPLDIDTVVRSVNRTGRLVMVDEGPLFASWSAELTAAVAERVPALEHVRRLGSPDHPLPFSPVLEDAALPTSQDVYDAVQHMLPQKESR
jgi:pyruvate/2-oxoglutarate/acetoin dehydrogenase E1 component